MTTPWTIFVKSLCNITYLPFMQPINTYWDKDNTKNKYFSKS